MMQIELPLTHDFVVKVQTISQLVVRAADAKAAEELVQAQIVEKDKHKIVSVIRVDKLAEMVEDEIDPPPKGGGPKPTTRGGTPGAGKQEKVEFVNVYAAKRA